MHNTTTMIRECDFLVIGSGLAGMSFALRVAQFGHVILLSKESRSLSNTSLAQGGVSAVTSSIDSFEEHIQDTLIAGAGLCNEQTVRAVVEQAPKRIQDLRSWGVHFDEELTREGGHSQRRILHVQDQTGLAIHRQLARNVQENSNIELLENHFAIDLICNRKVMPLSVSPNECYGAYALNTETGEVITFRAQMTALATGGLGKAYLYTSNWSGATGDGVAMARRAGARIANLEFMQFHPTCLYHASARNFLISEALRGEGAQLVDRNGVAFMEKYHAQGSLAPRDIVARAIDNEMKLTGADCVFLDITHRPSDFIRSRFPAIYDKCLSLGIDITRDLLPVVPAAHYMCGGILTDLNGQTDLQRLYAFGENACTGLHGANRLASNSLLECLAITYNGALVAKERLGETSALPDSLPEWDYHATQDQDEMIVIRHMWEEIRQLMWNYVGIVRSNRRLYRAQKRLKNIVAEIRGYYWNFKLHSDILELRNIATVADLTVRCALKRHESRGIHFNLDYPEQSITPPRDTII